MTDDAPTPSEAESAVYRRAFRLGGIVLAGGAVLAALIGFLVADVMGLWAGVAGIAVAALAGLMTPAAMQLAHRQPPHVMAAIILGTWLAKMVVIVIAVLLLGQIDGFPRPVFGVAVIGGILVTLGIDAVVLTRGRVPYTTSGSKDRDE